MDAVELVSILLEGNDAAIAKAVADTSFLKLCNQPLSNGQYAIHALASKKSAKGVEVLLQRGVNVNQESEEPGNSLGFTAAHYAAAGNCAPVLDTLKAHNADFDHPAADKWTPLHVATFRGQSAALEKLVDFGANIDCANGEGHTPLVFAVNLGRVRDVRFLLQHKASIQVSDANQDNLLHYALHYRMAQTLQGQYKLPDSQLDVAVLLVLNGIRPDERNAAGDLPTRYAEATLPSLPRALTDLFDNAIQLLCAPVQLNYLTLATATPEYLVNTIGLEESRAGELVGVLHTLEAERLATNHKGTPAPRPAAGAAAAAAPDALPAGHPTVPAEYMNLQSGDPTNGKCPFLARAAKQQANKGHGCGNNASEDDRPHCPFSLYTIQRHKMTLLLMGGAFLFGYGCGLARKA